MPDFTQHIHHPEYNPPSSVEPRNIRGTFRILVGPYGHVARDACEIFRLGYVHGHPQEYDDVRPWHTIGSSKVGLVESMNDGGQFISCSIAGDSPLLDEELSTMSSIVFATHFPESRRIAGFCLPRVMIKDHWTRAKARERYDQATKDGIFMKSGEGQSFPFRVLVLDNGVAFDHVLRV